jgi:hypothetical protein
MALDVSRMVVATLRVLFGLGPQVVRPATYVKPVGLNRYTGVEVRSEVTASCLVLVGKWALPQWSPGMLTAGSERLVVRASDLITVTAPGAGDFVVENATALVWRLVAGVSEGGGQFWIFQAERRGDEYWGDLVGAVAATEDRGDLTSATLREDWLGLD